MDYFLDTSIVIDYIRGKKEIVNFINELRASLYINFIVIAELSEGIFRVKDSKTMELGIETFINGMDGVLPINYDISREFGRIRAALRKNGEMIEDMDILIAATCIKNNMPLLTLNKKHFERINNLKIFTPSDFKV